MKYFYITLFSIFLFSSVIFSQNRPKSGNQTKNYTYTFSGDITGDNLKSFEDVISKIEFVEKAKVKYKTDSKKGIVYFQTNEKSVIREGESFFEIKKVKHKIEEFGLTPLQFTSEN